MRGNEPKKNGLREATDREATDREEMYGTRGGGGDDDELGWIDEMESRSIG